MKKILSLFFLSLLLCSAGYTQKRVDLYRAGGLVASYSTVQDAVDNAMDKDSLVLSPHTFREAVQHTTHKGLIFQGSISGGDTSTIDGTRDSSAGGYTLLLGGSISKRRYAIRDIIITGGVQGGLAVPGLSDTCIISGNTIIRKNGNDVGFHGAFGIGTLATAGLTIISGGYTIISGNVRILDNVSCSGGGINFGGAYQLSTLYGLPPGILIIKDSVRISGNRATKASIHTPVYADGSAYKTGIGGGITVHDGVDSWKLGPAILNIQDKVRISGNNADSAGGGMCIYGYNRVNIGKDVIIEGNTAKKGGAFAMLKNKEYRMRTYAGANPQLGNLSVSGAQLIFNKADSGAAIYIMADTYDSFSVNINIGFARIYNPPVNTNQVAVSLVPRFPPHNIIFSGNWWGKSDTVGVMKNNPADAEALANWAVADWSINGGTALSAVDTVFPLSADIKYNHGGSFPAGSFPALKGTFGADTGNFDPSVSPINASNTIASTFHTFEDSAATSANAEFYGWVDADTFRATVLIWARDTLTESNAIKSQNKNMVSLYPNPAKENISIRGLNGSGNIALYDQAGKKVLSINYISGETGKTIPLNQLSGGIYHVLLTNDKGERANARVKKE